jgi:cell division septation protein DedD
MAKKRLKKQPAKATPEGAGVSFRDGMVRWGVIFLVSAWMFLLGILVGRGTAPLQFEFDSLQKELIALRDEDAAEARRRLRIDTESLNGQPPLEFHEALKESDESEGITGQPEVSAEKPETASKPIENKTPLVTKGPLPSKTGGNAAGNPPAPPPKKPAEKETAAGKPVAATMSPGGEGKFTVQVASFKEADDADRMVAALKKKNYPAYRIAGIIPDKGIWHRVRVGGFDSSAAAKAMVKKLKTDRISAFVVTGK